MGEEMGMKSVNLDNLHEELEKLKVSMNWRRRLPGDPASTTTPPADALALPHNAAASIIAPPEPTFSTTTTTILASAGLCLAGFIAWRVTRWLRAKPRPVEEQEDSPV